MAKPLDAEAVAFSVNRMVDPELNSEQLSYFSTFQSAEAVDSTTVRLTTSWPGPDPARAFVLLYDLAA